MIYQYLELSPWIPIRRDASNFSRDTSSLSSVNTVFNKVFNASSFDKGKTLHPPFTLQAFEKYLEFPAFVNPSKDGFKVWFKKRYVIWIFGSLSDANAETILKQKWYWILGEFLLSSHITAGKIQSERFNCKFRI